MGTSPIPYKTTSQHKKKRKKKKRKRSSSLQRLGYVLQWTTTKPVPTWTSGIQHISPGLLPRHLCTGLPPNSFLGGHAEQEKCSGLTNARAGITYGVDSHNTPCWMPTGDLSLKRLSWAIHKQIFIWRPAKWGVRMPRAEKIPSGCRGLMSLRWLSWKNFSLSSWVRG